MNRLQMRMGSIGTTHALFVGELVRNPRVEPIFCKVYAKLKEILKSLFPDFQTEI
ncbi:hypothetical protein Plim_0536 [Planctopirus limnophila DSM 3776]|uniref:Uncharacterized protein n=1 Tax=Planctopirus limnophila (strain ATCC 43296 / DSM 3776 / IFAM 1008 / Mu 290) TaxID=521674 RepID=D5SQD2_PLAL2|nr:hypothetical protein Plim_0536 [Planctopirus limnophila DSM 3776]